MIKTNSHLQFLIAEGPYYFVQQIQLINILQNPNSRERVFSYKSIYAIWITGLSIQRQHNCDALVSIS